MRISIKSYIIIYFSYIKGITMNLNFRICLGIHVCAIKWVICELMFFGNSILLMPNFIPLNLLMAFDNWLYVIKTSISWCSCRTRVHCNVVHLGEIVNGWYSDYRWLLSIRCNFRYSVYCPFITSTDCAKLLWKFTSLYHLSYLSCKNHIRENCLEKM